MPRITKLLVAVLLVVAAAARPAGAQIVAGDRSISLNGMYMTLSGVEDVTFSMGMGQLGFNKFQTSKFAWRLSGLIQIVDTGDDDAQTMTGVGGGLEWNFNEEGRTTIPFVALDVNLFTASDESYTMLSPSAGFRAFLSRSTSFDMAASYNTIVAGPEDTSGGLIMLRMGLSYYLGKDPRR